MGLDVGDKRIGIAFSDEGGIIASPRATLHLKGLTKALDQLAEMASNENVGEILVGLPISMDGSHGPQAQKVVKFIQALSEKTDIPIVTWDERLTTVAAERVLLEGDVSRRRRRHVIDKVAAAYMLQSYLDFQSQK